MELSLGLKVELLVFYILVVEVGYTSSSTSTGGLIRFLFI